MTKKNILIAALLSVTAIGGGSVAAHAMLDKGPMRADTNGDGVVSRAEFFAAAETRFKSRDANSDRTLAGDEMRSRRGRFARLDTNNDSKLSFAEAAVGTSTRFARLDADKDGKLTPEEMRPFGGRRHHGGPRMAQDDEARPGPGGGGMGAMMLRRVDTNNDGRISRDEMRAQADQRFDRLDANKDGFIDQTELQAQRGRMGGRGGGMRGQGMDDMPPPPPPPAPGDQ